MANLFYMINSVFVQIMFIYTYKNDCKYFPEAIIVGMLFLMAKQEIRCFDFEETKATMSESEFIVFIIIQCIS